MPPPADENLERALRALRVEYLADAPRRLAELWSAIERVQDDGLDAVAALRLLVHRLAGSGGGYGLPEVTTTAQAADRYCRALVEAGARPAPSDIVCLRELVQGVADAFARAQSPE